MNKQESREISSLLLAMAENFGASMSDALTQLFLAKLKPFPADQVKHGLERVLLTRKYKSMPTMAEVLESVRGNTEEDRKALAESAWQTIRIALPSGKQPELDQAGLAALRSIGGWNRLSMMTYRDLDFTRAKYLDAYQISAQRPELMPGSEHKQLPGKVLELAKGIGW
jgi:hypothetical protein